MNAIHDYYLLLRTNKQDDMKSTKIALYEYLSTNFFCDPVVLESICKPTDKRGQYDWRADKKLDGIWYIWMLK